VGCDYVCVSAGAISSEAKIRSEPGYLTPYSEILRRKTGIGTMVTGLIYDPRLAEEIVREGRADAVAVARAFLDDPRWTWRAAEILGTTLQYPMQYVRAHPSRWAGASALRSPKTDRPIGAL
jgi:NADPH2 dehydrogenase